ncbi:MAG TPA: tetratricopeptide repeat protein [Dermatophilaceae bacterium]|nr:tetratricopeptide repeat protein [Dermatophilaceae bacterium]
MSVYSTPFALRYELAQRLYEQADYLRAAEALVELVDEATLDGTLHNTTDLRLLLARAYFRSAQLGRAESTLRVIVEETPTDGYAHMLLGRTLQRRGRHDEARRWLTLAEILGDFDRPRPYGGALPEIGDGECD